MATSLVSISNMALSQLGANTITDLGLDEKNSQLCDQFIEPTIDEILRLHPWNCAYYRKTIAALATAPDFGYAYKYTLPTSPHCLRALRINGDWQYEFKIEGRELLTDESTVNLEYIKRIVNPAEFDSLVISVLVTRMAWRLAFPITQSVTVRKSALEEFQKALSEARAADAQEGTAEEFTASSWINSRLE